MAYITAEMLEEFSGKYPEENSTMPQVYVDSAMETVNRYLKYNPEETEYVATVWGEGSSEIVLPAPCIEILAVEINGIPQKTEGWLFKKNYLYHQLENGNKEILSSNQKVKVAFKGGFSVVPQKIIITALQLASLYWESAGGNLAVSSTSFADMGTRVFNNFHEDRFLNQINEWRIYNV